jgi:hypothetical protein
MQRPRLTERTAEALATAKGYLVAEIDIAWGDEGVPKENKHDLKRAITYLEDLLRWHRSRVASPDDGPTKSPALSIVPAD